LKKIIFISIWALALAGCRFYSFTGGQYSGAKTFSVDYIKPQTALATPAYAQRLTESLKDLLLSQSPLKFVEAEGDLQYSGVITGYAITPQAIGAGGNETAALNRLSITIKINYVNTIEPELNFEKSFMRFADYDSATDLTAVEEELWRTINEQLTIEIFNNSVGNW
jgi:Lipopolysaccharide-assembly